MTVGLCLHQRLILSVRCHLLVARQAGSSGDSARTYTYTQAPLLWGICALQRPNWPGTCKMGLLWSRPAWLWLRSSRTLQPSECAPSILLEENQNGPPTGPPSRAKSPLDCLGRPWGLGPECLHLGKQWQWESRGSPAGRPLHTRGPTRESRVRVPWGTDGRPYSWA